ncbi:MAG: cobalt-precorrin-5B (C(1))-methyltransferase [Desulfofustis sp.]|nr:cobalt-precorrin-5B (C(1))-methyltransferase [Desulfofustis sp.]
MGRKLRSGYTTGACAAAAARAAVTALLTGRDLPHVKVIFPDHSIVEFEVHGYRQGESSIIASVIKDAGDDPDVTNGAVIEAEVRRTGQDSGKTDRLKIKGGTGVGTVTKPGLAVEVGRPAINPVPRQMIQENVEKAVLEAVKIGVRPRLPRGKTWSDPNFGLEVIIHVPEGEELAKQTLNERLGIIGGISILGTTGIVRPVSADAWTGTIKSCLDVAEANGIKEIILSTGRTSEKCIQQVLKPKDEALVMMGDYLAFSLKEVRRYSFTRVRVATMWAKLLKGAMGYSQTHVRHGILDTRQVCEFFEKKGINPGLITRVGSANTSREIYDIVIGAGGEDIISLVCSHAEKKYQSLAGVPVSVHLVNSSGNLVNLDR